MKTEPAPDSASLARAARMNHTSLFEPLRLGSLVLPSRIAGSEASFRFVAVDVETD
jgi:hypothetical protein